MKVHPLHRTFGGRNLQAAPAAIITMVPWRNYISESLATQVNAG